MNNQNQTPLLSVLITGCSSGIGYDLCHYLRTQNYRVIASCRDTNDCAKLEAEGFTCIPLDLVSSDSIDQAVHWLVGQNIQLYGLVNNGAFAVPGAVEDLSREALEFQFQTNVFGTHELTQKVLPLMRSQQQGRIVQISSILGGLCLPYRGAYNASKYALEALTDTLRLELYGTDIKCSIVQPGPITSKFRQNSLTNFKRFIDAENSPHQALYSKVLQRLDSPSPVPFTLSERAVSQSVLHALRSSNPKARYHVTLPTRVFLPLKRLLPDKWMDTLLRAIGD